MALKNIAVAGATGLVGRTMLKVLEERNIEHGNITLLASARSVGMKIPYRGTELTVEELTDNSFKNIDIALFSAGGDTSKRFAPSAAADGAIVVDNSSAWRMVEEIPLVVPEVNPEDIATHKNIIANPNCSTIQMVVALKPLHDAFGLQAVNVSTYQSISGAGQKGVDKLMGEIETGSSKDKQMIAYNTLFHPDSGTGSGFTNEEEKMMFETRKIMHLPDLRITATCVRLPVLGGHAESVTAEFDKDFDLNEVRELLSNSPGVIVMDDLANDIYPTPAISKDKDEVFVGRIRRNPGCKNSLQMWVVSDNLRKGAATNAVQIAEKLMA